MPTTFEVVRSLLTEAGAEGLPQSDLLSRLRDDPRVENRRDGTYSSFVKMFHTLKMLGWVERTGQEAPSTTNDANVVGVLEPRVWYRLTATGRSADPNDWVNPYVVLYPQSADKSRYYTPTGRPRGRPPQPRRVDVTPIPLVDRQEVIVVPQEDVTVIPPAETGRRRMRIPVSTLIERQLRDMLPRVETLRENADDLDAVERDLLAIFDEAADALERVSGSERQRVEAFAQRLERASEGFERMRLGLATDNRLTYLEGLETVLGCCRF